VIDRIESRLARLERRKQAEPATLTVVWDKNFYGNAHLLPPNAWGRDGQAAESDEGPTPEPGGED
jgi:hypothetical protein